MNVLFTVLTVFVLIAAILITLIVLLQNGKGGGLASNFVAGNQTFGVRQTADILEKITWGLVAFIFVFAILINVFTLNKGTQEIDITDKIQTEEAAPAFPSQLPATDAPAEPATDAAQE